MDVGSVRNTDFKLPSKLHDTYEMNSTSNNMNLKQ